MPKTTIYAELYCYGNPVVKGTWGGVKLMDLLSLAGFDSNVQSVDFKATDGYTVHLPREMATDPSVIVAYERDNASLPETLRLVVPFANGDVWIAQLTSISMSTTPIVGSHSTTSERQAMNPAGFVNTYTPKTASPSPTPQPNPPTSTPSATATPTPTPQNATEPPTLQLPAESTPLYAQLPVWVAVGAVLAVALASFAVFRRRKPGVYALV